MSFDHVTVLCINISMVFCTLQKKVTENKEPVPEKKKPSEKEPAEKDKELSVSLLNIQVGLIRKASKHPSADR